MGIELSKRTKRTVRDAVIAVVVVSVFVGITHEIADTEYFLGVSKCGMETKDNEAVSDIRGVLFQTAGTIAALGVFGSVLGAHTDLMSLNTGRRWQPIVERIATIAVFLCLLWLLVVQVAFMLYLAVCPVPDKTAVITWLIYTAYLFCALLSGMVIGKISRTRDDPDGPDGGNGGEPGGGGNPPKKGTKSRSAKPDEEP